MVCRWALSSRWHLDNLRFAPKNHICTNHILHRFSCHYSPLSQWHASQKQPSTVAYIKIIWITAIVINLWSQKNCHESLLVIKKGVGAWKAQKNKKSHQQMHTVCDFITKSIFVFIHTSQSSSSSATVSLIHTNPLPNANSKQFTQKKIKVALVNANVNDMRWKSIFNYMYCIFCVCQKPLKLMGC